MLELERELAHARRAVTGIRREIEGYRVTQKIEYLRIGPTPSLTRASNDVFDQTSVLFGGSACGDVSAINRKFEHVEPERRAQAVDGEVARAEMAGGDA